MGLFSRKSKSEASKKVEDDDVIRDSEDVPLVFKRLSAMSADELMEQLPKSYFTQECDGAKIFLETIPRDCSDVSEWCMNEYMDYDAAMDTVNDRLSKAVLKNHSTFINGMELVQEIDIDLAHALSNVDSCKTNLKHTRKEMVEASLEIARIDLLKRNKLKFVEVAKGIQETFQLEQSMENAMGEGDAVKSIEIHNQLNQKLIEQKDLEILNNLRARVQEYGKKLGGIVKQQLCQSIIPKFDISSYSRAVEGWRMISEINNLNDGSSRRLSIESKLVMELQQLLEGSIEEDLLKVAFDIVNSDRSPSATPVSKPRSIRAGFSAIPQRLLGATFHNVAISMIELLKTYFLIGQWHQYHNSEEKHSIESLLVEVPFFNNPNKKNMKQPEGTPSSSRKTDDLLLEIWTNQRNSFWTAMESNVLKCLDTTWGTSNVEPDVAANIHSSISLLITFGEAFGCATEGLQLGLKTHLRTTVRAEHKRLSVFVRDAVNDIKTEVVECHPSQTIIDSCQRVLKQTQKDSTVVTIDEEKKISQKWSFELLATFELPQPNALVINNEWPECTSIIQSFAICVQRHLSWAVALPATAGDCLMLLQRLWEVLVHSLCWKFMSPSAFTDPKSPEFPSLIPNRKTFLDLVRNPSSEESVISASEEASSSSTASNSQSLGNEHIRIAEYLCNCKDFVTLKKSLQNLHRQLQNDVGGPDLTQTNQARSLSECCVMGESLAACAELLQKLAPALEDSSPEEYAHMLPAFFEKVDSLAIQARGLLYRACASTLLFEQIMKVGNNSSKNLIDRVLDCKWKTNGNNMPSESSPYVDWLILVVNECWQSLEDTSSRSRIPSVLREVLYCFTLSRTYDELMAGYGRINRCSKTGRAQMGLDLTMFATSVKQPRYDCCGHSKDSVLAFVNAFYQPSCNDLLGWIKKFKHFFADSQLKMLFDSFSSQSGQSLKKNTKVARSQRLMFLIN
eukprot:TRINITY_DN6321_c0_g1_i1.p1 TRINITY_DN6321_c0_g1~~TRINITY_DN6321_c0_g1_i1.p1  ORF type:complete len:963 (+),score=266.08 TRINITY_DN6321_c0_g1_i1:157-3045(+)